LNSPHNQRLQPSVTGGLKWTPLSRQLLVEFKVVRAGMTFTHTVAHRAATVNAPATSSKNEFATSVCSRVTGRHLR